MRLARFRWKKPFIIKSTRIVWLFISLTKHAYRSNSHDVFVTNQNCLWLHSLSHYFYCMSSFLIRLCNNRPVVLYMFVGPYIAAYSCLVVTIIVHGDQPLKDMWCWNIMEKLHTGDSFTYNSISYVHARHSCPFRDWF